MTNKEFSSAEVRWAKGILAKPAYTMPNGKDSHEVAFSVIGKVLDRLPETHRVNAFGEWK